MPKRWHLWADGRECVNKLHNICSVGGKETKIMREKSRGTQTQTQGHLIKLQSGRRGFHLLPQTAKIYYMRSTATSLPGAEDPRLRKVQENLMWLGGRKGKRNWGETCAPGRELWKRKCSCGLGSPHGRGRSAGTEGELQSLRGKEIHRGQNSAAVPALPQLMTQNYTRQSSWGWKL